MRVHAKSRQSHSDVGSGRRFMHVRGTFSASSQSRPGPPRSAPPRSTTENDSPAVPMLLATPATNVLHATPRFSAPIAMEAKLESPIPGFDRPAYLDGMLAGDVGLDPLNFVERFKVGVTVGVPAMETTEDEVTNGEYKTLKTVKNSKLYMKDIVLGPNTERTERSLMWMREAEVKHARLAMLAAAGWPLAELWHGGLCKIFGAEYLLDATQGRSLSVLNGGLGQVAPFLFLAALGASAVEWKTLDQVYGLTATGKTMKPNGQLVMKSYVPGDCGFDPLNLYGWHGANVGAMAQMRAEADPEFAFELAERSRREMETAEIKNGRLAMLAITGYAFQEFFWHTPVVDQTPIFFTFFGDLLAPGAMASLGLY